MPHRNKQPAEKHFSSFNLGDQSFFTSAFPVPRDTPEVTKIVSKKVPTFMDTIFVTKGAMTTHETESIPLQPLSTKIRLENEHAKDFILRSRHFTLGALTEGTDLQSFSLQIDQNLSQVDSFSLFIQASTKSGAPKKFELRGIVDPEDDDSIYEFVAYEKDEREETILVDESVARDVTLALCELHEARALPSQSLESSLLTALGAADGFRTEESGIYRPDDDGRIEMTLERAQTIKKGLVRTTFLSVLLVDTIATPLTTTKRTFKFTRDTSKRPAASASLSYLITAHDDEYGHDSRESTFESESTMFRGAPIVLYEAIEKSLDRPASEPLD